MQKDDASSKLAISDLNMQPLLSPSLTSSLLSATHCIMQKGDAASKLAISDLNSPAIHLYDVASGSEEPIASLSSLHASPVAVMRFNAAANAVISSDAKGKSVSTLVVGLLQFS
jgi:peptidylprolyl isomerase domain and WD repeat-containing protein 1